MVQSKSPPLQIQVDSPTSCLKVWTFHMGASPAADSQVREELCFTVLTEEHWSDCVAVLLIIDQLYQLSSINVTVS